MTDKKSSVPETNSSQWRKNEKMINDNPVLKKARDIQQGMEKPDRHYKQTHGGKGSASRINTNSQQWRDNWDRIFGGDRSNVNHREEDE